RRRSERRSSATWPSRAPTATRFPLRKVASDLWMLSDRLQCLDGCLLWREHRIERGLDHLLGEYERQPLEVARPIGLERRQPEHGSEPHRLVREPRVWKAALVDVLPPDSAAVARGAEHLDTSRAKASGLLARAA